MYMARKQLIIASLVLACALGMATQAVSAFEVAAPAPGRTYTWNVLQTNGVVEWWTNAWSNLGNKTITVPGNITYTLGGLHPNDELGTTNITGAVWFGDVQGWTAPAGGGALGLNWTVENCSATETGMALSLSAVYNDASWNTHVGWNAGFIVNTNWTRNLAILNNKAADSNITATLAGNVFTVTVKQDLQTTTLEYDTTSGVLLYGKTAFGNYHLEIILDGYVRPIPGFGTLGLLAAAGAAVLLVAWAKRRNLRS